MFTVREWTGREARALRTAKRLSVRAFADHLGVAVRTVSKWEAHGVSIRPRPDTQAVLDTVLTQLTAAERVRFQRLLSDAGILVPVRDAWPVDWDYESWTDDLERSAISLSHQDYQLADTLLNRWLARFPADDLDARGLYLHARSLVLLGDARRDQGSLTGPLSARRSYRQAMSIFSELEIPRRVAQVELSLMVIAEMSGDLRTAAQGYEALAADERLSPRDRARSRLWIGTALSKAGDHDRAVRMMDSAIHQFDDLDEVEDWSVAHQKLALAHRGAGELDQALRYMDVALTNGVGEAPLQRVRLRTAHAHILLGDRATSDQGLALLDQTARTATRYGLAHQLGSIRTILENHHR